MTVGLRCLGGLSEFVAVVVGFGWFDSDSGMLGCLVDWMEVVVVVLAMLADCDVVGKLSVGAAVAAVACLYCWFDFLLEFGKLIALE